MIVTFQYLRNFNSNVNWAVCFMEMKKKTVLEQK